MIKAIETEYKGYRFRSRLEARWAVFFDALGIDWLYEPEGFDINGTCYLPDFYLPKQKTWVEIKGREPTDDDRFKCHILADETHETVFLLSGTPGNTNSANGVMPDYGCEAFVGWHTADVVLAPVIHSVYSAYFNPDTGFLAPELESKGFLCGSFEGMSERERILTIVERDKACSLAMPKHWGSDWRFGMTDRNSALSFHGGKLCSDLFECDGVAITAALNAARSARFEHGQSGARAA